MDAEQIGVVAIALDLVIGTVADDIPECCEQLNEDADRISFGMGIESIYNVPGEAIERGIV